MINLWRRKSKDEVLRFQFRSKEEATLLIHAATCGMAFLGKSLTTEQLAVLSGLLEKMGPKAGIDLMRRLRKFLEQVGGL